jgi:hypothetical protein
VTGGQPASQEEGALIAQDMISLWFASSTADPDAIANQKPQVPKPKLKANDGRV